MAFDCIATQVSDRERDGYGRAVQSRSRVLSFVTVAALTAAGVVVFGVVATRGHVPASAKPRSGHPPLSLSLGDRADREARELVRGQRLYADKKYSQAAVIFGRYRSLEAQVGSALAAWPSGSIARLENLQAAHRRSALVGLHLGLAYYWDRRNDDALAVWRAAARDQPDTAYAVRIGDFLHPQYAPGLPPFLPSFQPSLRIRALPGPQQVAALRADAALGGAHAKLLYGTILQQLGRPVSAEREFAAAVRLAPDDPDARVAAAVGRFDKANPSRAFGTLGPLTRVFPHAQTVRFHLGLLLLWSAQVKEARKQLQQARREGPNTLLGRQATQYLAALDRIGTG
jgi:tetratricopeptide (TPR) repeat protein